MPHTHKQLPVAESIFTTALAFFWKYVTLFHTFLSHFSPTLPHNTLLHCPITAGLAKANAKQPNFQNAAGAVLKTSFISQGRKELLLLPLTHHFLPGHNASWRVGIPVFCLRSSLRSLTHLRVCLRAHSYDHLPSYHMKGGFIAWLQCNSMHTEY